MDFKLNFISIAHIIQVLMNRLFVLLFALLLPVAAFAQGEGEIEPATIDIVKNRKIELPEATREPAPVTIPAQPVKTTPLKYSYLDYKLNLPDIDSKVKVVTMKPDLLEKLYGNYVLAGAGNYGTTYLEGFFNNKRTSDFAYGVHVKHLASARGPVKLEDNNNYSRQSENVIGAYTRYFTDDYIVAGGLNYSRERYNYYGYQPPVSDKRLKQLYNTVNFNANLSSRKAEPFGYKAGIAFSNLADNFSAREAEFNINADFGYTIDKKTRLDINTTNAFTKHTDSLGSEGRNYLSLRPAVTHRIDNLLLTGGLNFVYHNDTLNNSKGVHVYPNINADYTLKPDVATIFAGINGDVQKRTLKTFVAENPFAGPNLLLAHTNNTLNIYVGAKGKVNNEVSYQVKVAYQTYKNLPFFVNGLPGNMPAVNLQDTAKFQVIYDTGNSTVFNLGGDIAYTFSENFRLGLNLNYNNYSLATFNKPYSVSPFTAAINSTYNLRNKVLFTGVFHYNSAFTALRPTTLTETEVGGFADLDLRADYRFSPRLSAFISLDNILNQKNPRYLYYPTRGFMAMGGLAVSF